MNMIPVSNYNDNAFKKRLFFFCLAASLLLFFSCTATVRAEVNASDVEDGSYPVEVQVVSGDQTIKEATLTAENGELTLHLTMQNGDKADYPLEALDQDFKAGSLTIRVLSNSLPKGSLKTTASKAYDSLTFETLTLPDGTWSVPVTLKGGSGRASVTTPCRVTVEDGRATARLTWSSPHYDYMIVGGLKYLPENNTGGDSGKNSEFDIPVPALDKAMTVIGDTTAMSRPYEIEYQLTFSSEGAKRDRSSGATTKAGAAENAGRFVGIVIVAAIVAFIIKKYRENHKEKKS